MNDKKFALLIDADNTSFNYMSTIIKELTNEGIITIKRIYGDWTNPTLDGWKKVLLENSILPIQQYSYTTGKNATDSAMIIDAMDILYSGNVEGFCLVSSDSDFTRLAARLRESGMVVIGMGRKHTPKPFVVSCNQFKYLDLISIDSSVEQIQMDTSILPKKINQNNPTTNTETLEEGTNSEVGNIDSSITSDLKKLVEDTIRECIRESDDEWVLVSQLGTLLKKRYSDFDCRNFGYSKMTTLLESIGFHLKKTKNPNNKSNPNGFECFVQI